jgi:hypothetical protein
MDDQGRLREVSWQELFPWLRIVAALRLAVSPSLLALGALGAVATAAGWIAIGRLFVDSENQAVDSENQVVDGENQAVQKILTTIRWPWEEWPGYEREIPEKVAGVETDAVRVADVGAISDNVPDVSASPFFDVWGDLSLPFREMFNWQIGILPFFLLLLLALWALVVWSLFGSAITRIAAVALARGDWLGFRAGLAHGIRRWPLYLGSPAIPLVGAIAIAIPLLIGGALAHPALETFGDVMVFVGALFWPLALLAGFVMALLLVGLAVGWPLMWATISVEATDPFDALSRAYSYSFHRPIRYLFYVVVAAVLGLLGWYVVDLFYQLIIKLSYWGLSWGATSERTAAIQSEAANLLRGGEYPIDATNSKTFLNGTYIIGFWHGCLRTLAVGFIYSYFWSAATAIYYVLRKDEDGMEMSEVTYEEPGEARGLPPLTTDTMGVPAVSDIQPPPSTHSTPPPTTPSS